MDMAARYYAPETYEHGNFSDDQKNMACSSTDDISLLENDHYPPKVTTTGKSFDPRLLVLLEYFRELYERKGDLFRKIFPGIHDEFVEFFKKFGELLSQVKSHNQMRGMRTLQRSFKCWFAAQSCIEGDESPLRLERLKIRTEFPRVVAKVAVSRVTVTDQDL